MTKAALALSLWMAGTPLWAAGSAKAPSPIRNYRQAAAGAAFRAYLAPGPEANLPNLRAAALLAQYQEVDKGWLWSRFGTQLRQKLDGLVQNARSPEKTPVQVGQVEAALRLIKHIFKAQMTPAEQLQLRDLQSHAATAQAAAVKRDMEGKALAAGLGKKAEADEAAQTIVGTEAAPQAAVAGGQETAGAKTAEANVPTGAPQQASPASEANATFQALADLLHASQAGSVANGSVFYKLVRLARTHSREERLLLGILAQLAHYGIQKETRVERMLTRIANIEAVAEVAQSDQVKVEAIVMLMDAAARTRSHFFAEEASKAVKSLGTEKGASARVRETAYAYLMREAKLTAGIGSRKAALALAEDVRRAAAEAKVDLRVISLEDPAAREIGRRHHLLGQIQDAAATPAGLAATLLALTATAAAAWVAVATWPLPATAAVLASALAFWVGLQGLRHRAIAWAFAHMGLIAGHIAFIVGISLMWAAQGQIERAVLVWISGSAGLAFNAWFSRRSFDRGYEGAATLAMALIALFSVYFSFMSGGPR